MFYAYTQHATSATFCMSCNQGFLCVFISVSVYFKTDTTNASFYFSTSLSSNPAYSPFVLKKDISVPWGKTILTSRDELLTERQDSWHAADICRKAAKQLHSYMSVEYMTEYSKMMWIRRVLCNMASSVWKKQGRTWALLSGPHELCCSLHIFTYWEIDATGLCSNGLRYIWGDNEIALCPDWRGWWHRCEIALVFPWL